MEKVQEKELTRAEKFFTFVAHMRQMQKEFFMLSGEIRKEKDDARVKQLKEEQQKVLSKAKAAEKVIDDEIKYVDDYYTKNKLFKFWKDERNIN